MAPGFVDINAPNVPDLAVLRLRVPVSGVAPLSLASSTPPVGTALLGVGFGRDASNDNAGFKRSGTMVLKTTVASSATVPSGGGRVRSKSRDGADGVTVLMRSGAQSRAPRDRCCASFCVRG